MSVVKKLMTGAAALSLVSVPVAASAAGASKLSLSKQVRSGKATKGQKAEGDAGSFIVPAIAAAAVIAGIVIVANNDNKATSP